MTNIEIKHLAFRPGSHPKRAEFVLADADSEENAQVWIQGRFPIEARSDDKIAVLAQEVLRELQRLADVGIKAAKAPPTRSV